MQITKYSSESIYKIVILSLIILCIGFDSKAQNQTYSQFSNEIQFTETIKDRWVTEFNIGQAYTSTPPYNKSMLSKASQFYLRGWVHYYLNPKWKLSYFYSFFFNVDIPEIDQKNYHEIRSAIQGIYYMHKVGYTLQSRFRIEDRHIQDSTKTFQAFYRLRSQIKYIKPINSKVFRKGVYYGFGAEELFFKTQAVITGKDFFDRNRITLGGGYCFSDDVQLELSYVNEFLPRGNGNQTYNQFQANLCINDFFKKMKNKNKVHKEIHAIDNDN
jgi:hypothetical protein